MKPFADYDKTEVYQGGERLPKGAYVMKVLNVAIKNEQNFNGQAQDRMYISCDIAEGEFKDFYLHQYMANSQEDKKWKCVFKLWIPTDDGSEADTKTKRMFKTKIQEFEASNEGYHWDWDEQKLKGKIIGGLFNDKEYDFNGRHGWFTNFKYTCPVHQIADGTYKMPEDEPLQQTSSAPKEDFMAIPDNADLPFA